MSSTSLILEKQLSYGVNPIVPLFRDLTGDEIEGEKVEKISNGEIGGQMMSRVLKISRTKALFLSPIIVKFFVLVPLLIAIFFLSRILLSAVSTAGGNWFFWAIMSLGSFGVFVGEMIGISEICKSVEKEL